MRSWKTFVLSLLALGLLGAARPAAAQTVLITNLYHDLYALNEISSSNVIGQAFITDGVARNLHSFDAPLDFHDGALPSQVTATLYSVDSEGFINSALKTLRPASSLGGNLYRFAGDSFNLSPSTKYFMVLGMTGTGYAHWEFTYSHEKQGPGSLALSGFKAMAFSTDSGGTWRHTSASNGVHQFQVNVNDVPTEAVPEPGALLLFLPALGAVALLRRRR